MKLQIYLYNTFYFLDTKFRQCRTKVTTEIHMLYFFHDLQLHKTILYKLYIHNLVLNNYISFFILSINIDCIYFSSTAFLYSYYHHANLSSSLPSLLASTYPFPTPYRVYSIDRFPEYVKRCTSIGNLKVPQTNTQKFFERK